MPGTLALRPPRHRLAAAGAALATAVALAACGSQTQDAGVKPATYPVQITAASFPTSQHLTQHTRMVLTIRNAGTHAIPDLAVTVCPGTCHYPAPRGEGTSSAVFGSSLGQDSLDNPTVPPWAVERNPGPCPANPIPEQPQNGCQGGGGGGWATQYPDTWATGAPVAPGQSRTFVWDVVAEAPGHYTVAWQVAPDLYDKTHAVISGGGSPEGTFRVSVSGTPTQSYVNNNGQIESGSGQGQP